MTNYVTTAEANSYLGISGQDNLINELIGYAMAIVNNYCKVDDFDIHDITDQEFDYKGNGPYYLRHSVVNSLSEVNKESFTGKYRLQGRKLSFGPSEIIDYYDEDWQNILFTYNVGYDVAGGDLPNDIKLATLQVVSYLYNKRKSEGVKSFTIGDLSATFDGDTKQINKFKNYLSSYIVHYVVGC